MAVATSTKTVIQRRQDLYQGCLLGGAVGDALGAPVEFMSHAAIAGEFGPNGIQEYAPAYGRNGAITDDTQMALFTAEGVVRAWVRAYVHAPSAIPSSIARAYQRWLHTECLNGWLITQRALHSRRAPGNTCLSGLQGMHVFEALASNDSKGCGGVMRVAPVGMYYASLATQSPDSKETFLRECFDLGCTSAAITHGHPTGQLATGAFAAIIMQLLLGMDLPQAIESALPLLKGKPHHAETLDAIHSATRLAAPTPKAAATKAAIAEMGGGWVAEEALAIALYCALEATDFRSGVVMAVNHSGDSDSTGSMAGQLLGAMLGVHAIPASWLESLELKAVVVSMADDLATFCEWKRQDAIDNKQTANHIARYAQP